MHLSLPTRWTLPPIAPATGEDEPRGAGVVTAADGATFPLREIDLRAVVDSADGVELVVDQRFSNDRLTPAEVLYTFPLPARFAVVAFEATLGGRTVVAELTERHAARDAYDAAVLSGTRAALAEQDRDEVFTLSLGNVTPGEEVRCVLRLVGVAAVDHGEATLRLPLVVAPRYNPGSALDGAPVGAGTADDTDAAPDASRVSPPRAAGPLGVAVTAVIDAPTAIARTARCSSHAAATAEQLGSDRSRITLTVAEPDRDIVVRWDSIGPGETTATITADAEAAGTGDSEPDAILTLRAVPARSQRPRTPRDVIVLLDRSGSMYGWKITAARRAAARIADACSSDDRLAVWAFANDVTAAPGHERLAPATDAHRYAASSWLGQLDAEGGTELAAVLASAAELLGSPAGRDAVLVVVTDAQVTDEDRCVRAVSRGRARVVVVGVDAAANGTLCDRLARATGGWSETVESADRLDEVLTRLTRAVAAPDWPDLELDVDGADICDVVPAVLPDGYASTPVTVRARIRRDGDSPVVARLRSAGTVVAETVAAADTSPAASVLYARQLLADLEDSYAAGRDLATGASEDLDTLARRIVDVSLRYGVLCRHTAFVAVDPDGDVVSDGAPVLAVQPAATPYSWASLNAMAAPPQLAANALRAQYAPSGAAEAHGIMRTRGSSVTGWDWTGDVLLGSAAGLGAPSTRQRIWRPPATDGDPSAALAELAERIAARVRAGRPDGAELRRWAQQLARLATDARLAGASRELTDRVAALEQALRNAAAALTSDDAVAVHLERVADAAAALVRWHSTAGRRHRGAFWRT